MKPLSRRKRLLSISILFLVFVILAPIIIAYSEGYRFGKLDDVFKIVKTGGVYIHSGGVPNTQVYVNEKFVKNSGLLFRNTFVKNLRPGDEYQIEVFKDGHHAYIKTLPVFSSLVTEVTTLMLPLEIEKRIILEYIDSGNNLTSVSSATTSVNGRSNLVPNTKNNEYQNLMVLFGLASSTEEIAISKQINTPVATKVATSGTSTNEIVEKKEIPKFFIDLGIEDPDELENLIVLSNEVSWLEDGNIIINWIGKSENIPYYYCLSLGVDCRDKIVLDWHDDIIRFDYLPGRFDVWVVLVPSGIWAVEIDDRGGRNIQPIYLGSDLDFRINSTNRIVVQEEEVFIELKF